MFKAEGARILVVDDEPRLADTLAVILQRAGFTVKAVYSGEEALDSMEAHKPALVVTDVMMPGLNGIALAKAIRTSFPDCEVLLFSGNGDTEILLQAARQEGYAFEILAKPVPPPQMIAKISSLLMI